MAGFQDFVLNPKSLILEMITQVSLKKVFTKKIMFSLNAEVFTLKQKWYLHMSNDSAWLCFMLVESRKFGLSHQLQFSFNWGHESRKEPL